MDADHFDTFARTLVSRRSRRRLAATAGVLLGGLLADPLFGGAHDALAKNKKKKKKKKKKQPPCSAQGGCPPCQECVNGECQWIPFPDCYGCQEPLCEGGVFNCKETGVGIPCGEHCLGAYECCTNQVPGCPAEQTCCATSTDGAQGTCIDPEIECCGAGYAGVPCEGDCCNLDPPQLQTCCTAHPLLPKDKYCYSLLPPCPACEQPCGDKGLCCPVSEECCEDSDTDPVTYSCAPSCP